MMRDKRHYKRLVPLIKISLLVEVFVVNDDDCFVLQERRQQNEKIKVLAKRKENTNIMLLLVMDKAKELIQQKFKQDLNLYVHTLYDNFTNAVTPECRVAESRWVGKTFDFYYAIDR